MLLEYKDNFHDMIARYNRELLDAYHRRHAEETVELPLPLVADEPQESVAISEPQESAVAVSTPFEEPVPLPPEIGVLQVWVTTASASLPLQGIHVTVSDASDGKEHTIRYSGETDESGRTEAISLPAASAQGSLSPAGQTTPFTLYDIAVYKDGFYRVENRGVPLYGGVRAVQPVRLIPLPEGEFSGTLIYRDSAPVGLEERE